MLAIQAIYVYCKGMRNCVFLAIALLVATSMGCSVQAPPFAVPNKIDKRFVGSCNNKVFYKEFVRKKAWVLTLGNATTLRAGKVLHKKMTPGDTLTATLYLDDYSALEFYQIPYCNDTVYDDLVKCNRHAANSGTLDMYCAKADGGNNYWVVLKNVQFVGDTTEINDTVFFKNY